MITLRFKPSFLLLSSLFLMGLLLPFPHTRATAESCTFVQLCDTQLGMGGYEEDKARFRAAVKAINAMDVNWVVICGDLVDNGGDEKAIADFRAIVETFTVPCYLAPGNQIRRPSGRRAQGPRPRLLFRGELRIQDYDPEHPVLEGPHGWRDRKT